MKTNKRYYQNISTLKLKWWQKIILLFKKPYIGVDIGYGGDKIYYVVCKKLGDKTIVLEAGEADITIGIDKASEPI